MANESEWTIWVDPTRRAVRLAGRLDAVNADAIYEALATIADPRPAVTIDLSGVTHCTSAFFKCLIDVRSRLERLGSGITITSVSAEVEYLLAQHGAVEQFGFAEV